MEYLLKNGAPRVSSEVKDNDYWIKNKKKYTFLEDGKDRGEGIRKKAQEILDLISDDELLSQEREKSKNLREKISQGGGIKNKVAYSGMGSGG